MQSHVVTCSAPQLEQAGTAHLHRVVDIESQVLQGHIGLGREASRTELVTDRPQLQCLYPSDHLQPGGSLTVILNSGNLQEEGDVWVGEAIVALSRLPGEEYFTQLRATSQRDIGWRGDHCYRMTV